MKFELEKCYKHPPDNCFIAECTDMNTQLALNENGHQGLKCSKCDMYIPLEKLSWLNAPKLPYHIPLSLEERNIKLDDWGEHPILIETVSIIKVDNANKATECRCGKIYPFALLKL